MTGKLVIPCTRRNFLNPDGDPPIEIGTSILLGAAHRDEANAIAAISRLQVEHGLNWRWTKTKVRRQIEDPEFRVLVASVDGVLEGFAIMQLSTAEAHLLLLAVESKSLRFGIGTTLVSWLEESSLAANFDQIRLEVRASKIGAVRYYERLGYQCAEQLAGYYDRKESAVVLMRSLVSGTRNA